MSSLLLEKLISRGKQSFRELSPTANHTAASPELRGSYLICRAPSVPQLWNSFEKALHEKLTLVIIPPSSALEEEILLRQLPPAPPPQAVLALFTSGSTGEPKAVFHSEASLLASGRQLARAFPGTGNMASLLPAWGMGGFAFHLLLPLFRSGQICFSSSPFLSWASEAIRIFRENEVELLSLNPFLLEMFLRGGVDQSWKGWVVSLTSPLKKSLAVGWADQSGNRPHEIYGMTEAAGPVLMDARSLGAETRISKSGELELRGEQLFLGYSHQGKFSKRTEWFPTGDIFSGKQKSYKFESRIREIIDSGGRKIAPRVIEEAFEQMPELSECLAFPVELAGVERAGLIYVRESSCKLSKCELKSAVEAWSKNSLSSDLRPAQWAEVQSIPRTKAGKPDRSKALVPNS